MFAQPEEVLAMVVFARVVEAKRFTPAASRLGLAKSADSTRISSLQQPLGVRLLQRTPPKLSLTPEGLALYERCARVASAADEAAAAAAGTGATPRGLLRLNAPMAFAEDHLSEPLA